MFETLRLVSRGTPVPKEEVVTTWLAIELEKYSHTELEACLADAPDVAAGLTTQVFEGENEAWRSQLSLAEKEAVLDTLTNGPVHVFWLHEPLQWYRIEFTEAEFEQLRTIPWPDWIGWGDASQPDGTIARAAQTFLASDPDDEQLTGDFEFIDLDYIHELAMAEEWPVTDPVIALQQDARTPPAIIDGNHRLAAAFLRVLRGEPYRPVTAYVGVRTANWELLAQRWLHRVRLHLETVRS